MWTAAPSWWHWAKPRSYSRSAEGRFMSAQMLDVLWMYMCCSCCMLGCCGNISKTDSPKQQNEILHVYLAENMHQRSIDDGLWHNHFCTRQPKDVCLGQRHAEEAGIRYASPEDSLLKLRMTCLSLLRHIPVCLLFLTWTDYATLFL